MNCVGSSNIGGCGTRVRRALAQGVSVLLLVEPTSALDPELREEVREVLRKVARGAQDASGPGLTILLVTHEHALAYELADEIWTLASATIVSKSEPPKNLEFVARSNTLFHRQVAMESRSAKFS